MEIKRILQSIHLSLPTGQSRQVRLDVRMMAGNKS